MSEFLVTMRPAYLNHDFEEVRIVEADDFDECIEIAFFSRNIASSWHITEVLCDDVDVPHISEPITYEQFDRWRYKSRQNPNQRVSWSDYYKETL